MIQYIRYAIAWSLWKTIGMVSYHKSKLMHGGADPTTAPTLYTTHEWVLKAENNIIENYYTKIRCELGARPNIVYFTMEHSSEIVSYEIQVAGRVIGKGTTRIKAWRDAYKYTRDYFYE